MYQVILSINNNEEVAVQDAVRRVCATPGNPSKTS